MNSPPNSEPPVESPQSEQFYARALPRMLRMILIAGIILLPVMVWVCGWVGMLGAAAGVAVSYINFRALSKGVEGLTDRIVNLQSKEKGRVIVWRFLFRYGLVGIAAYAIFKGSASAFRGFLWGLCVPVAAMMIEAGVEAYIAFRE